MAHWIVNGAVLALVLGAAYLVRTVRRNAMWSQAARQLWLRRPIALLVVALYLLIGLFDSISWIGGGSGDAADLVALHKPRSVLDRMFPDDFKERSYSAPLADVEFYGGEPLANPGSHLLGTDILGRDVLHLTLKGVRIATVGLTMTGVSKDLAQFQALSAFTGSGFTTEESEEIVNHPLRRRRKIRNVLLGVDINP